jgi:hypothetical protein
VSFSPFHKWYYTTVPENNMGGSRPCPSRQHLCTCVAAFPSRAATCHARCALCVYPSMPYGTVCHPRRQQGATGSGWRGYPHNPVALLTRRPWWIGAEQRERRISPYPSSREVGRRPRGRAENRAIYARATTAQLLPLGVRCVHMQWSSIVPPVASPPADERDAHETKKIKKIRS